MPKTKIISSNCLATIYPNLVKQWHPTRNFPLTPFDVTPKSGKKVWWKCNISDDHEWISSISHRANGTNCPCCNGKKAVLSNCLATTHPEASKKWHPTKNNTLTPFDVVANSNKEVWWKCNKVSDHEWMARIVNVAKTTEGCPCCNGKKAVLSNCLATTHPEISIQWHQTKNFPLTPYSVTPGSAKKVWWKCDVVPDHEWQMIISNRTHGRQGCSCCANRQVVLSNCIATTHPHLIGEWHPTKNFPLTPYNTCAESHQKVWWKCNVSEDHEWQTITYHRTSGSGCPCCTGQKAVLSNCLATTHAELSKQWHHKKNLHVTPFDVTHGSSKKVWWKCSAVDNHEWKACIMNRVNGNGCPFCFENKGEKRIITILISMNIKYEIQKKFDNCKYERKLPFDFYLPEHNVLIEYDGHHHFKAIEYFGGIKNLEMTKRRDKIKNKFAKKYNIPLLRIPYTKFDRIQDEIMNFLGIKRQQELF